jgi:hypothetical protein
MQGSRQAFWVGDTNREVEKMSKGKRGRPAHWRQGRLLRGLWQEANEKTGIGLRKQTEKWASEGLPAGTYPTKVSADALLKAIRRSVKHAIRGPHGERRLVPTILNWDVTGVGGGRSSGSASSALVRREPSENHNRASQ